MQRPMQQMRHGMMPLNRAASIGVYGDAHRFARLRCAAFAQHGPMNKNVAAFLGINHTQLTDLRPIVPRHMK